MPGFFIKNILIINDKNGEYNSRINLEIHSGRASKTVIINNGAPDNKRTERIVEQIKIFAEYAQSNHDEKQLTRVVTDEFSFYTKNSPLSIEEYKDIINKSYEVLKNVPPNIVLIISSMPVLWPDGALRNAVLHIQSPNSRQSGAIIHHLSKEHFSLVDPVYSKDNTSVNCYPLKADDYSSLEYSPDVVLGDTRVKCFDKNQYKTAIIVKGVGIPPLIDAIEICFDHEYGVAKANAAALLRNNRDPSYYISQIVTSYTIEIDEDNLISTVVHADKESKGVEGVEEQKNESIKTVFGEKNTAFTYYEKRAEIVHSELLDLAINNIKIPLSHIVDIDDNTILHEALLLNKKSTPQCTVQRKRLNSILKYFDEHSINKKNKEGNTPFHLAVHALYQEDILIQFLEHGARLDIKNNAGISPIGILYKKNENKLLLALCNKLINNDRIYQNHRHTCFDLINEMQDPLNTKAALGMFNKEVRQVEPDAKIIVNLLKKIKNPVYIIYKNIERLSSLMKQGMDLYHYLLTTTIFIEEHIKDFTSATKIKFLKQELLLQFPSAERINLFLKTQNKLQFKCDDAQCEHLFTIKFLFPKGLKHLNPQEQMMVKAYLTNNYERFKNIVRQNQKVSFNKIASVFSLSMKQHVKEWLKLKSSQVDLERIISNEYNSLNNIEDLRKALAGCKNWNVDCGLKNGLTIGEQALIHALKVKSVLLIKDVLNKGIDVTQCLQNIEKKYPKLAGSIKLELIKINPQQALIKELQKGKQADEKIILDCLINHEFPLDVSYLNTSLSLEEQIIAQAFISQNKLIIAMDKKLLITTRKIQKIADSFIENSEVVHDWLMRAWIQNNPKAFINEKLGFWMDPVGIDNPMLVAVALSHPEVDLKAQNYNLFKKGLQIAYNHNSFSLLQMLYFKSGKITAELMDYMELSQETVNWINKELIKIEPKQSLRNELERFLMASINNLIEVLSSPDIKLNDNAGVKSGFTNAEQVVLLSYMIHRYLLDSSPSLLIEKVYLLHGTVDTQKITAGLSHSHKDAEAWIKKEFEKIASQEALKKVLQQGISDEKSSTFEHLSKINLNLDCGLDNKLSIGEQALVQAFIHKNSNLMQSVLKNGFILNQKVIKKIIKVSPYEMNIWLYQELMKAEFKKGCKANLAVILEGLSLPQMQLDVPCGLDNGLSLAEEIIAQVWISSDYFMGNSYKNILELVYPKLNLMKGSSAIIKKIALTLGIYEEAAEIWIRNEFRKLEHQAQLKIIFRENAYGFKKPIINHLPPNAPTINLNADCGLSNGLSIEEQLIVEAFMNKDSELFECLLDMDLCIKDLSITKIIFSFNYPPNSKWGSVKAEDLSAWLKNQEKNCLRGNIIPVENIMPKKDLIELVDNDLRNQKEQIALSQLSKFSLFSNSLQEQKITFDRKIPRMSREKWG